MRGLLLVLLASLPVLRPQDAPPAPERVRAVLAQLERAFEGRKPAEKIVALKSAAEVVAPAVIAGVAKGLGDANEDVRVEAIDALGRMAHADAFKALAEHYRSQRRELRKQERVLPRLLRALARHGRETSIALLVDDVPAQMLQATLRARIIGLGNVRSKVSVDALLALVRTIGFIEMHDHAEDLRLALLVLTGVDQGRSPEAWQNWWTEHGERFELPAHPPRLASADWERWIAFWGAAVGGVERSDVPPAPREH